jgi:hypothetical protein
LGGGVIGNQFDPSTGSGIFSVTYTVDAGSGCAASSTQTIQVEVCTGIIGKDKINSINLFPNPAISDFTIQSGQVMETILMYDCTGKLVQQIELNALQTTLDVSDFAKGIYHLNVLMKDQTRRNLKIVKE